VPAELDARFDSLDPDAALRPTTLKLGPMWTKRGANASKLLAAPSGGAAGGALLAQQEEEEAIVLGAEEQRKERARAFDLLDALSRSGGLPLDHAELHVVVCATHGFDESVADTVVRKNVNPIERAERSALVMASVVHGLGPHAAGPLLRPEHRRRVQAKSPRLFAPADPSAKT